jgi:hypothetical protein
MRVEYIEKAEDCLEAEKVFDFILSEKITDGFIKYCGEKGKLIYKDKFEKPYFKVLVKEKYSFKGAIDNNIIRVLFADESDENEFLNELEVFFNGYSNLE